MHGVMHNGSASEVRTAYVDVSGGRLAYRSIGEGRAFLLCTRFRGTMDSWDPLFIDALARQFRVIVFDYSGLGSSTGVASYDPKSLARDVVELADALHIDKLIIGGWCIGGIAAQVLFASWPERISHAVLIGTTPPGKVNHGPDPAMFDRALKAHNDFDDEVALFFEPRSSLSVNAARSSRDRTAARRQDRCAAIPEPIYVRLLKRCDHADLFHDDGGYRAFLAGTSTPILVLSGDNDRLFPVQNWLELTPRWTSLHVLVLPSAGHAAHHQYPDISAEMIAAFINDTTSAMAGGT